jgi:ParB-like chromosome segregation protein Spo0J
MEIEKIKKFGPGDIMKIEPGDTSRFQTIASGIPVYCSHTKIENIKEIKPNPNNVAKHPEKQITLLAKIIKEQGWRNSIVISSRSGFIVKGHGRFQAAKMLNATEIPIDIQQYQTEDQEYADLIADNKIAELAEIDDEQIKYLFKELDSKKFNIKLTGYDTSEIEEIMKQKIEASQIPVYCAHTEIKL